MGSEPKPEQLVPFRWPSVWTDPKMLGLIEGGPINCLLFEGPPGAAIDEAARKTGLVTREWSALAATPLEGANWDSTSGVVALTGLVWPRLTPAVRSGGQVKAVGGPTGAPWIDSNSWVARLAACRAPTKQFWLGFAPPEDLVLSEGAYRLAIADAAATGARWMITLDRRLIAGLAEGSADAIQTWRGMLSALSFFEKRRAWRSYMPDGPLGVVSTYSGASEHMGAEFLNLAARRNLLYRVFDATRAGSANWRGLRAVIYLDEEKPAAPLVEKLAAFGRGGGLLIASRGAASAFAGERPVDCPVAGYDLRRYGRGLLAVPARAWEDPYWVVLDAQDLVSRRYDPVRLFNGSSSWLHYSVPAGGAGALIQLVGFSGSPMPSVSLRINRPHRAVRMHTFAAAGGVPLEPVRVDNHLEYHLPEFSIYAALEVTA
jgi:hypothetical protein